ncbi:riboflavin synthase [Campylobacter coli]|uniref:Riboflavin synthase n=3 Tax=Campylobacter TaxID=194 RepID=A0A0Q2GUF4_CAMCO|nr:MULTISPECIES: riboflavin synthase [Campylobacter]EAI7420451.1 riboflavin synthase [Campylobacter hyointestinalis]EAK5659704.1 riboflavin synthase [Campylobacter fetus]ECB3502707.1 riboflavin synthase [Salmonella enterica subsp. enterica serovar Mississippi]ECL3092230.1 riboflavin synthase [Campylobacter jejuni]EIA57690.1 riboflavin synthase subunit alpha [Campylobacter coli 2692]EIA58301.1 riboflavin synthase subunit alpha [Campylobacter coli 2698]EIA69755.1 riboflavin synthase subunit al
MFNGLIREIAKVKSYQNNVLNLKANYRPNLGDSVAVNGACLSVTKLHSDGFELELSHESRKHIAVQNLKDKVHIEPALRYGDRIDGHLMQGHIDFIGRLEKIEKDENGVDFYIALPKEAMKFMARKGSIGIDGVSLTINEIIENGVRLTIIPITFKETLFKEYEIGREINIESDLLARYIYAQMQDKDKGLSWEEVERIAYLY